MGGLTSAARGTEQGEWKFSRQRWIADVMVVL